MIIVFKNSNQTFGIKIDTIREIIKIAPITALPQCPPFIKGILNVRGEIVTIIDIQLLFSLAENNNNESKHIIVMKHEENLFGLMVEEVIEITRITKNMSHSAFLPSYINMQHISEVILYGNQPILLLDPHLMFSSKEMLNIPEKFKNIPLDIHFKNEGSFI